MDGFDSLGDGPSPPSRLFERLAQIPGYTWDQSIKPHHTVSASRLMEGLNEFSLPSTVQFTTEI